MSFAYERTPVVADISVSATAGEVLGLVGPNGSGKTTLFRLVLGFEQPTAGTVSVLGHTAGLPAARAQVGYVPSEFPSGLLHTVDELLALQATLQPSFDPELAEQLLGTFGLASLRRRLVVELSHGTRKRCQLVVGLAHRPGVLLLDEPFSGLDPDAHALLVDVVHAARVAGVTTVVAAHETRALEAVADSVLVLREGRAVAQGPVSELLDQHGVASLGDLYVELVSAPVERDERRRRIAAVLDRSGAGAAR